MLNVEVRLKPCPDTFAELDLTLRRLVSGKPESTCEWLKLAPHYLQKNAVLIPPSHFSILGGALAVRPFGNIAIEGSVKPTESGSRKHELLLVRNAESWKAVVVFAKAAGKRKKKRKKEAKRDPAPVSIVSGGLPSLGKRR